MLIIGFVMANSKKATCPVVGDFRQPVDVFAFRLMFEKGALFEQVGAWFGDQEEVVRAIASGLCPHRLFVPLRLAEIGGDQRDDRALNEMRQRLALIGDEDGVIFDRLVDQREDCLVLTVERRGQGVMGWRCVVKAPEPGHIDQGVGEKAGEKGRGRDLSKRALL